MSRHDQFYLRWRGKVSGPFSWSEVERKLESHEVGLLHDFQHNNEWTTLGEYLAARGDVVRVTPNVPVGAPPTAGDFTSAPALVPAAPRVRWTPNRWIFVALGLLFGFAGIHDFYAHHWIRGGLLLAIAALLLALDWGIIWPWLWAIGEIIVIKVDGAGRTMPWKRPPRNPPS